MPSVSSVGINSGVLTSDLIDQLADAERSGTEARLNRRDEEISAKLSDIGRIRSALSDLRLSSRGLDDSGNVVEKTANSTSTFVSAEVTEEAANGSYQVDVTNLAVAHSLKSGSFADKTTTTVGTGTLSISVGGTTTDLTVDSSNNTLEGIASLINDEDMGVNASVIFTGSDYQLVLSSENTGVDNAISISVTDNDGNDTDTSGLSQFVFNGTTQNLTESVAAEDAVFSVNGVGITRSSNSVDDAIEGVTLNLTGETSGSPATLTIGVDSTAVADRVEDFVEKFNSFQEIINEVTDFNTDTGLSGTLTGNAAVRSINNQVRSIISNIVPGLESANVRSLSEVGISTNKDTGLLTFNRSTFQSQLEDNAKDVTALFADQGRTTDSQIKFVQSSTLTTVGTYDVEIDALATQGNLVGAKDVSTGVTIGATNDTFKIEVDGTESNTITLTAGTYTSAELVTEIQDQLNADTNLAGAGVAVTVSLDGSNQLQFSSSTYGQSSSVNITEVDTTSLADLGLDVASGTDGTDVAGKINGQTATGSGRFLFAPSGDDSSGIKLEVTGGTTGSRGTVSYLEGVADQMISLVNGFFDLEGTITVAEDGFNQQLTGIAGERVALEDRITTLRSRLERQFTFADIQVGRLNNTREFLEAQLGALTRSGDD